MTNTSVVLGIATLGTPEAIPDCDWATPDAMGSAAIRKGIIIFIGFSFRFSLVMVPLSTSMLTLDVASYRGLKRNFAGMRVSIRIGTRRYRTPHRCWYYKVPCSQRRGRWLGQRCQNAASKAVMKTRCASAYL